MHACLLISHWFSLFEILACISFLTLEKNLQILNTLGWPVRFCTEASLQDSTVKFKYAAQAEASRKSLSQRGRIKVCFSSCISATRQRAHMVVTVQDSLIVLLATTSLPSNILLRAKAHFILIKLQQTCLNLSPHKTLSDGKSPSVLALIDSLMRVKTPQLKLRPVFRMCSLTVKKGLAKIHLRLCNT